MSNKGMHVLHSRKLLLDLKHVSLELCENYICGKQKRVIFPRVEKHDKSEKLGLVHIDVWVSVQV